LPYRIACWLALSKRYSSGLAGLGASNGFAF
jgi:hypothetical protein